MMRSRPTLERGRTAAACGAKPRTTLLKRSNRTVRLSCPLPNRDGARLLQVDYPHSEYAAVADSQRRWTPVGLA